MTLARTQPLELGDGTEAARPRSFRDAVLVVPLAPEKSVEIKCAETADRGGHLALKRLAAHLTVGNDFEADTFL